MIDWSTIWEFIDFRRDFHVEGYGGGFDGVIALLFFLEDVSEPRFAYRPRRNDPGVGNKGIYQGGLAVTHVTYHRQVADVSLLPHRGYQLLL